jgi:hypothetical protein
MMASLVPFEPVPADYPNHLAIPHPERLQLPSARWLLLLLLVACLLPRVVMIFRLPIICIDGPIYVNYARALEAGNYRGALMEGAVNIYPIILMLLHRLGLAWETAGAIWGVTMSCLVVLPLWGWVRRQFDDRVALAACLLYIAHPKFIIESPEVTRDPTFWFLFTLSIYLIWRAVTEVRYRFFLAAGVTIALAALTRVEGVFLLIPLVLWTFWRLLALRTDRKKLLIGALFCVPAFPVMLLAINVALFYDHLGLATIRLSPLARIEPWLESLCGFEASGAIGRSGPKMAIGRMLCVFFPTITRGLAPLFAVLMFGGIWVWRRLWARRDNQALFCTAVVILIGIWVQLWYDGNISRRYPLPIVLMASPFAALALLALAIYAQQAVQWLGWRVQGQRAAAVATVVIFMVAGLVHAIKSTDEPRRITADVSLWVRRDFATPPVIVGPSMMERIVRYYAEPRDYFSIPADADDEAILKLIADQKPDVVILWPTKRLTTEHCTSLIERMKPSGLTPIHPDVLPEAANRFFVLVRAEKIVRARKPTRER